MIVDLEEGYKRFDSMEEEDVDDPLAIPLSSLSPSDHYTHSYHAGRSNSWRQNSQNQTENQAELISDHQPSYSNVKNESHTVQHYCSSQNIPRTIVMTEQFTRSNEYSLINSDDMISNSYIPSSLSESNVQVDTHEDEHTRGQLIQEISRVIEDFGPYSSANEPSRSSRSSNIPISNSQQTAECNYVSPDGENNWIWTRPGGPSDNRVANPSGNCFFTGPNQATGVSSSYHYNHDANFSGHISSLNSTSHSLPSVTSPSRDAPHSYIVPSSALDLSPSHGTISVGTSASKTHDVGQFRGSIVNCNQSPPPAAHLQPSLLQHLDLRPHHLEGALDMVTSETSHNHSSLTEKINSGTSHKQLRSEASHTHAPLTEKVNCATSHRDTKETPHNISSHGVKRNNNEHEKTVLTESYNNTQQMEGRMTSQQQQISMKGGSRFEDAFECGECGALFSNMTHLKCHMKVHELIPLPLSLKDKERHENVHQQQHIESDKYQYKCDKCDTSYTTKILLLRHKKIHSAKKLYSCNECPSVLTEAGSLKVHKRLHSGEKPFKCSVCQQAFSGAGLLATHSRKHTGEKPYSCTNCGMSFRLLSTLKSHMRRHTGEKPFSCEMCHTSFTQRAALKRHQRTHSDYKPWECQHCGFKFREKENLRKHMTLHKLKSQHTCEVCGEGFNQAKKLETHKMIHNGGDRPFKCLKCPSSFTNSKYLTQHKKRVHERKGAIRCEECHATFKRKETYKAHMQIHAGDKPFVCEECGAAFNQRGTLTKHLRIHYGENTSSELQCKHCGLKYGDKDSLEKHLGIHKEERLPQKIEILYCDKCSNTYSCKEDLRLHSKLCHSVYKSENYVDCSDDIDDCKEMSNGKYTCEECDQTFFRKRQLKAHRKYCMYRNPSPASPLTPAPHIQPPTVEGRTTGMYNPILVDNRDVDPIKLLTAVLSLTGTCDLSSPPPTNSSSEYNENNTVNTSTFSGMSQSSQHYYEHNPQEYQYNSQDYNDQHVHSIQNNSLRKSQDGYRSKNLRMQEAPEHIHNSLNGNTLHDHTSQYGQTSHGHTSQHSYSEHGHSLQHGHASQGQILQHDHTLQNGHTQNQQNIQHFDDIHQFGYHDNHHQDIQTSSMQFGNRKLDTRHPIAHNDHG